MNPENKTNRQTPMKTDPDSFDFAAWRSCMDQVLNETLRQLLMEGDRQGEPALREQIAVYLQQSRGIRCTREQVIVSAGAQQLVTHLAKLLKQMEIEHISTEEPGYTPVRSIFRDWGFSISSVPVRQDGIAIEKLPANIRTAAYVCPQNQFPTGAQMPEERRRQLLRWAEDNDSLVIEDDYNSALNDPDAALPALYGLDGGQRVVYMGTFSPTLFPAVRISYMVLPEHMMRLFDGIKQEYDQTCSKTEQLTLARFMEQGFYLDNLERARRLYAEKLRAALDAIAEYGSSGRFMSAENTKSGVNIILKMDTHARMISEGTAGSDRSEEIRREMTCRMTAAAAGLGIKVRGIDQLSRDGRIYLILSYNQIPLDEIRGSIREMIRAFRAEIMKGGLRIPSVYEVIRLIGGKPQFLPEHYARLENSLGSIGLETPFTCEELERSIRLLAQEGEIRDHNLKLEVDISGHGELYMNPTHYPSAEQYRQGVRAGLLQGERKNPHIKMMDHALRDAADAAIHRQQVYEVLLTDRSGRITEGSRSNVFFLKGGEVFTPPLQQVLPGITRDKIIGILREHGIPFHEAPIAEADLASFDAAFLSGTSPKVLPLSCIGEIRYDVDAPLLRDLMRWYDALL